MKYVTLLVKTDTIIFIVKNSKFFYRPSPYPELNSDIWLQQLDKNFSNHNWHAMKFRFWRITELFKYRNHKSILLLHWPEGFWRSKSKFICLFKAIYFIIIFYISKFLGYRWVWVSHNVIPHYLYVSLRLEKIMRKFIIKNFDLIVGPSYNSKNDLTKEFGSTGKKYLQAFLCDERGEFYPTIGSKEIRHSLNIEKDKKIILCMNTLFRKNKGVEDLLNSWLDRKNKDADVHLLLTGIKPKKISELLKDKNFTFIEGSLSEQHLSNLFSSVDFLFLNYKSITNSGQFYLATNYFLPVIVPDLDFFKMHSSTKTSIFFDSSEKLSNQIDKIIDKIQKNWKFDRAEMEKMNFNYDPKNSMSRLIGQLKALIE